MHPAGGARGLFGRLLGRVLRVWSRSWRVTILEEGSVLGSPEPVVLCFWHGAQMPLLGYRRRRPTAVLVSWSDDGRLQAGVLGALGMAVVRGSSSRGASAGLRGIVRHLRTGHDAAFAVDGPRGPLHVAQPGAAAAAELASARLIPMAAAARPCLVLGGTWDRFWVIPPFSQVTVAFGPPIDPVEARRNPGLIETAIEAAGNRARHALD